MKKLLLATAAVTVMTLASSFSLTAQKPGEEPSDGTEISLLACFLNGKPYLYTSPKNIDVCYGSGVYEDEPCTGDNSTLITAVNFCTGKMPGSTPLIPAGVSCADVVGSEYNQHWVTKVNMCVVTLHTAAVQKHQ